MEALREMAYHPEVHRHGAKLNSYYSEQEGKFANVIIRRRELPGGYGDVGFVRQPDGRLNMIGDELDDIAGYGSKWLDWVRQLYKGAGQGLPHCNRKPAQSSSYLMDSTLVKCCSALPRARDARSGDPKKLCR